MYTTGQKADMIIEKCLEISSIDLYRIFQALAECEFVNMHGPEHHIIDGASVIVAYHNAGGEIDLKDALERIAVQGLKIPVSVCSDWGVCGSAASVGAALNIIDKTSPLKDAPKWGDHMECTSNILLEISKIGNPRCCKRSASIALRYAAEYLKKNYNVTVLWNDPKCKFTYENEQCITDRCPFYHKEKTRVAFICTHNSCRSQIAEAIGRLYCADVFESYSAGTQEHDKINPDIVRLMKENYNIDITQLQYPKLVSDIPKPDIAVSMGCGVSCPDIKGGFDYDWGIPDPTGKNDEEYMKVIRTIARNVLELKRKLQYGH